MSLVPLMWILWAAFAGASLMLLVYRGNLTRYEEDALFLESSSRHQLKEQQVLLSKVHRVTPLVRAATICTCVVSAALLGIYVYDALKHINM